ncbi:hypothetical protein PROSTU_01802 [Providencia stuartii ATCC 25827]|uniref:Integrase n=1 Tax=Providencia stuartii ATCC 25827 TaxID=471874 RepID=A0AA86YK18_PROST|nr:hypothetical protein PROSTU_01802 [Providencia stuartii ATCC 25827]
MPLSEQVIDLLKQTHPISGSYQYIFPSRTDYRKHIPDMALNTMIRRMGYSGRHRPRLQAHNEHHPT